MGRSGPVGRSGPWGASAQLADHPALQIRERPESIIYFVAMADPLLSSELDWVRERSPSSGTKLEEEQPSVVVNIARANQLEARLRKVEEQLERLSSGDPAPFADR